MKAVDANGKSGEVKAPIFELTEDEKETKEKKPSALKSFLSMFGEIWRVMTSNFPKALIYPVFDFLRFRRFNIFRRINFKKNSTFRRFLYFDIF